MATVRVVVVNYGGGAITMRCVEALQRSALHGHELQIVVVDNASTDDVVADLRRDHPDVRVIQNTANEGFARGCNVAMQDLDGIDFVALINNDAVVADDWLAPLVAAAQPADVGAVCPKLLLNLHAHAVVIEAAVSSTLPDGRRVGVGVRSVHVDGVDRWGDVRADERLWAEPADPPEVRWTRRPTAAIWWPAAEDAIATATLALVAAAPTTVEIGDGVTSESVDVAPGEVDAVVRIAGTCRIINSAGCGLYDQWRGGDRGFLEPDLGQYDTAEEVFAWSGGAVLLKADYLRDVGLFDPTFFLYYEDFDLSWRGRSRGWRYRYEPASTVFHEHMYSSGPGSEFHRCWSNRNRRLTLVKNAPAAVAVRAVAGVFVALGRGAGVKESARILAAVPRALVERRRIRRSRTVPPADIRRWMTVR